MKICVCNKLIYSNFKSSFYNSWNCCTIWHWLIAWLILIFKRGEICASSISIKYHFLLQYFLHYHRLSLYSLEYKIKNICRLYMYRTEQNGTKVSFISNIKPETDRYEIIHVTITTNRHANELVKNGTAHFNNDLVLFQLKGMHKKVYDYC